MISELVRSSGMMLVIRAGAAVPTVAGALPPPAALAAAGLRAAARCAAGLAGRARELAALIRQISDEDVVGLFVENITNPDLVQQIADETGLQIGGRLYSDALSVRGGPATTYLSMMQHNISALLQALEPSN